MRAKINKLTVVLLWILLPLLGASPSLAAPANEPPRQLTGRGLDNLAAFTRLLGYVRFFHPSDQAAAANWDQVAIAGVQAAEKAVNPMDLARTLEDFFEPLAPTLRVFPDGERPQVPAALAPPSADAEVVFWEHNGVGLIPDDLYFSRRSTARSRPPAETGLSLPGEPLVVSLGGGVSAMIPLTLYRDSGGTLPRVTLPAPRPDKPAGFVPSGKDRATRLAGVALTWPVVQHFYPYFDVGTVDWPASLREALNKAARDRSEREWVDTLRRLTATLQDGHGGVIHPAAALPYQLPLTWDWIEDQLVITHVQPRQGGGLAAGDVVLAINGRPVEQAIAASETLWSAATPQYLRFRALRHLVRGQRNEAVRLTVRRANGQTASAVLRRTVPADSVSEPRPEKIAEIQPGIFYVDLERITDADFRAAVNRLAAARGIVFDLRVRANVSLLVLRHLAGEPLRSAPFRIPLVTLPDRPGLRFNNAGFTLDPAAPRLTGRIAFLTSGRVISYGETYMGIIDGYGLADIVGGPTAGTNGNVNIISLPGNAQILWTGMLVTQHDGSRLHGVGIQPTVPVSRTLQGVAGGRDEILERAIQIVGGQP